MIDEIGIFLVLLGAMEEREVDSYDDAMIEGRKMEKCSDSKSKTYLHKLTQ